jgi:hypothetical protein
VPGKNATDTNAMMPNKIDRTSGNVIIANARNTRKNTKKKANGAGEPEYSTPFLITSASTVLLIPQTHLLHITPNQGRPISLF